MNTIPIRGIGNCQGIPIVVPKVKLQDNIIITNFHVDLLNIKNPTSLIGVDVLDQFRMFKNPHTNFGLDDFDYNSYNLLYMNKKAIPIEEILNLL